MLRGDVKYAAESWRRLEREVFPRIGDKPLKKINAPMILTILRRIEKRGTLVVARKVTSHISQIMRYGIACGHIFTNPARDLGWALTPHKSKPRAAITEPKQIGLLMRDIQSFRSKMRRCALQLEALVIVRPGELCQAEWSEIEMDMGVWRIPGHKMKTKRPHIVPLSRQAQEVLRELRTLTGGCRWLFPSRWDKSRHMGGQVLNTALRRIGWPATVITAHGFRAMAATTLSEQGWPSDAIERQLAHVDKNAVRAAYQRSELLAERGKMMQAWADFLDMRCAWAILGK
ncbi:MAG: tyrosine-type recombinase/integrase [Deltaproteobacteria bacterium]|nr:tyrosine-type recombinase/integrase [Deltaproteobacteria bacterium]